MEVWHGFLLGSSFFWEIRNKIVFLEIVKNAQMLDIKKILLNNSTILPNCGRKYMFTLIWAFSNNFLRTMGMNFKWLTWIRWRVFRRFCILCRTFLSSFEGKDCRRDKFDTKWGTRRPPSSSGCRCWWTLTPPFWRPEIKNDFHFSIISNKNSNVLESQLSKLVKIISHKYF